MLSVRNKSGAHLGIITELDLGPSQWLPAYLTLTATTLWEIYLGLRLFLNSHRLATFHVAL